MIKRFISYYQAYKALFFLDMSMALLRSVCMIIVPLLTRDLFDITECSFRTFAIPIGMLLILTLIMMFSSFLNIKWGHILGARIETDMRRDLFCHLQKLSFTFFDKTKTGHIMSRISNDLNTISEVAHHAPEDLFISFCTLIGAFGCMFYINPTLAVIALLPLPVMVIWGMVCKGRFRSTVREMRKRIADVNSNVENAIQGIREVQSFTNEGHQEAKFEKVNSKFRISKEAMYNIMASFHAGMAGLIRLHTVIVASAGAVLAAKGSAEVVDVLAFIMYARFITMPIERMVNFVEQYSQGIASFERFVEIMDVEPDIQDAPNAKPLENIRGEIELKDLTFSYEGSPTPAVKSIDLKIFAGKVVALVGESGAGKSTIASLIPRFYEADKGEILIDGQAITQLPTHFLREHIGIVQQNPFLFDSSLRDNIVFGRPDTSEEEIIAAAKSANIYDFIQSLPEGFDSAVGEHGVKLSGGQKQRISIARVFLKNPPILIFDEATSALDNESEHLIQEALEKLCSGRSTLVIAHRLSTVKQADYTYVMRDGLIEEHGTHQQLLALDGYYASLYHKAQF